MPRHPQVAPNIAAMSGSVYTALAHRLATFEVVTDRETGINELRQDTIDRRQANILAALPQSVADIVRSQMAALALLQEFEDLDPWQRDLQTSLANLLGFHQLSSEDVAY